MFFITIFFIFRVSVILKFIFRIDMFFIFYKKYVLWLLYNYLEYGFLIIVINISIFYILTLLLKLISEYHKKENKDLSDLFLGAASLLEYINSTNYVIYIFLFFN